MTQKVGEKARIAQVLAMAERQEANQFSVRVVRSVYVSDVRSCWTVSDPSTPFPDEGTFHMVQLCGLPVERTSPLLLRMYGKPALFVLTCRRCLSLLSLTSECIVGLLCC